MGVLAAAPTSHVLASLLCKDATIDGCLHCWSPVCLCCWNTVCLCCVTRPAVTSLNHRGACSTSAAAADGAAELPRRAAAAGTFRNLPDAHVQPASGAVHEPRVLQARAVRAHARAPARHGVPAAPAAAAAAQLWRGLRVSTGTVSFFPRLPACTAKRAPSGPTWTWQLLLAGADCCVYSRDVFPLQAS